MIGATVNDAAAVMVEEAYEARRQGRVEEARSLYAHAAAMLRDPGVRRHARALRYAHAVRHVADIDREAGSKEKAETGYADAMAVYRGEPGASKLDVANALRGYALLRQERGDGTSASEMWEEARKLYTEVGVKAGVDEAERRMRLLAR